MLFQARGPVYLRELNTTTLVPGVAFEICPDSVSVTMSVEKWSHMNKCGATDVEDGRGINALSAEITFSFSHVQDKNFALAALGTINAVGSPGTVTAEALPAGIVAGDVYFLGGKERHRTITTLTIKDDASPQATLTADTDYTLDAVTGKVTFLTSIGTQPYVAAYGYTDPASVSMLTATQKEYAFDMEYINKQNSNDKGSLELYRVRFDPADGLDFLSDQQQTLTLKGSCLADTTRDSTDTEFGQFGRRVL